MHIDLEVYDELVTAVYRGPLEERPWSSLISLLSTHIPHSAVTLIFRKKASDGADSGFMLHVADEDQWAQQYNDIYCHIDPFVDLPNEQCLSIYEHMSRDVLQATRYYREFLAPLNVSDVVGVCARDEADDIHLRLRMCAFEPRQCFSEAEKQLLERLIKHLMQAAKIHKRLLMGLSAMAFTTEHIASLGAAAMVIDQAGSIISANRACELIVASSKLFVRKKSQLHFKSRSDQANFLALVREVIASEGQGPRGLVIKNDSGHPYLFIIKFMPYTKAYSYTSPAVLVSINDLDRGPVVDRTLLDDLFAFTSAEARLAELLMMGYDPKEAADALGVSINTVRTQIKSMFAKTGVNRQTDLLKVLWQLLL